MEVKRVKIPRLRRLIGENLNRSLQTFPHVQDVVSVDMSNLLALKEKYKEQGKKITVTTILVKVIALTLKEFSDLNVRVEEEELVYYDTVNVGVAVHHDKKGLLVPVIKDADTKSLIQISDDLNSIQDRINNNKITLDDFTGGNITLSNVSTGRFEFGNSILTNNEPFIIGVFRTKKTVVVDDQDNIVIRPICNMVVNYNHMVVDGVPANRFATRMCEIIENLQDFIG